LPSGCFTVVGRWSGGVIGRSVSMSVGKWVKSHSWSLNQVVLRVCCRDCALMTGTTLQ